MHELTGLSQVDDDDYEPSLTPVPIEISARLPAASQGRALSLSVMPPADMHPAAVYLAKLAPGSRRTMSEALDTVASILTNGRCNKQTLDWSAVRYQHTAAIRSVLADLYAAATANKVLAALRGVLREAWRLGLMDAEEFHRAVDIPAVRGSTPPRGRALARDELSSLFQGCAKDGSPAGMRDAAMLGVLYGCGLRRSELVALDVADFVRRDGSIHIRSGKGNKGRVSYASAGTMEALEAWLKVRGAQAGPLFCPVNKAGIITLRRISDQAVRKILIKRAKEAGVDSFSPHDLRRTMIGDLLDAGADIATVQKLAGHANVTTTARYDRRGEAAKKRASDLLNVPFQRASPRLETEGREAQEAEE